MGCRVNKTGDWAKARKAIMGLSKSIVPIMKGYINEVGDISLETMVGHIDSQNLDWEVLSEHTINLKNGDSTIYVDTGWTKENLEVKEVNYPKGKYSVFIGASADKVHPDSGLKFNELMVFLEYGTADSPERPLIRPSYDEIKELIKRTAKPRLSEELGADIV